MELNFDERRVVGTLIEKGYTTPEQYPLTINAIVNGSSQKSCRDPVVQLDEERVFLALDSLRKKGLVILVQMQGSRTDRWKHRFGETLGLEDKETAVLGELLLRGPQTDGEIRQRASRMVRLESLEDAGAILAKLAGRTPPLAARLSPEGRRRGVLFTHGLYPAAELEELRRREATIPEEPAEAEGAPSATPGPASALRQEVETLQAHVVALEIRLSRIEESLGLSSG